jgi:V8-like Glu-specific endopeptidase
VKLRVTTVAVVCAMVATLVMGLAVGASAQGRNAVASFSVPESARGMSLEDMASAKSLDLPQAPYAPQGEARAAALRGTPGFSPGATGDGRMRPEFVPLTEGEIDGPTPNEFGTSNHPFTTSRVDTVSLAGNVNPTSKLYPYRAAGKLFFKIGASSFVCSASLIKRGLIVTAAHCVTAFGGAWYTNFVFVPAKYDALAPYGTWTGVTAWAMTSYKNGTDSCAVSGIVCANDVAVISIKKNAVGAYPGNSTGWLGYGWDGYGFTVFNDQNVALINQLGYPVSHDAGNRMQRTDSQGFVDSGMSNNTVWGSRQTGGSSGGPEVVNLGTLATLSGTSVGSEASMNIVVGVTSWGYTSTAVKQMGASPFTSGNIVALVSAACTGASLTYCKP